MGEEKPNDLQEAHSVLGSECLLFPSLLSSGFAPRSAGVLARSLEIAIMPKACTTNVHLPVIYTIYTNRLNCIRDQ